VPGRLHAAHDPQCCGVFRSASQPFIGLPSQSPKPATHAIPQLVPSHVGVAFGGMGQGEHSRPQCCASRLFAQLPAQTWKPALHATPHEPLVQVAAPFGIPGHGEHETPHESVLESLTQTPPQL
jgi:hypothetical protein